MPADWAEIRRVLADAVDLPPADRAAFLGSACQGRPDLRAAVEDLIAGGDADATRGALNPDLGEPAAALLGDAVENPLSPGDLVGRYRVVRILGRGGMGVVYEARDERLTRAVALKVFSAVHAGAFLSRFAGEPRLLARLQHPGIAQVFEVGVHSLGGAPGLAVPYFAMELVENARHITEHALHHGLTTRARIGLLIDTCDAVAHGHSRGVIHRDLKPANILVGDAGRPKVIDFGVARAADEQLGLTRRTGIGQIVGTLRYMSPEALAEGGASADVRSDVYALGLVMYEVLSGSLPYTIDDSSVVRASRTIQDARRARLSAIDPALKGDIESIALKAVDADPARRYQSAAELGADLRRYLNHEPVTARPPSAAYQLRLFARRHKALVTAAGAGVLALIIGVVGTGVGLARAKAEARRAQRFATFLEKTFRTADPNRVAPGRAGAFTLEFAPETVWLRPVSRSDWPAAAPPGRVPTGVDVLRRAASRLDAEFPDEPLLRADLAFWIGTSLASLGDPTAASILRTAVEIRRGALGLAHEDTLRAVYAYAASFVDQRAADELIRLLAESQSAAEALYGRFDPRTLLFWDSRLAMMHGRPGPPCATADLAREKWDAARQSLGPGAFATLRLAMRVALHLNGCGRHEEAEALGRQTFATAEAGYGRDTLPMLILTQELIAVLAGSPDDAAEAEAMMRHSIEVADHFYGATAGSAFPRLGLARVLMSRRELAEAETLAREAVAGMVGSIPSSIHLAKAKGLLARILVWEARPQDADEARRLALEAAAEMLPFTGALGPFEDYALYHAAIAAGARRVAGDPAGAEAEIESLRTGAAAARGAIGPWADAYLLLERGQALAAQSRTADALEALRAARAVAETDIPDPTHPIRLSIGDALAPLERTP